MPIYEYRCDDCEQVFEAIQRISDEPLDACRHCGGAARRIVSSPAIQFLGSGWYVTDYARKTGERARTEKTDPRRRMGHRGSRTPRAKPVREIRPRKPVQQATPGLPLRGTSRAPTLRLNSLWIKWRERRDGQFSRWGRVARLTRRVREEYLVYFDRNATMSGTKCSGSGGMHRPPSPHRENWAA